MFYVYVLRNEVNKHYIGYSADLRNRIARHNAGDTKSTRGSQWQLMYYEAYEREHLARQRERHLKHHGQAKQALFKRLGS